MKQTNAKIEKNAKNHHCEKERDLLFLEIKGFKQKAIKAPKVKGRKKISNLGSRYKNKKQIPKGKNIL